MRGAATFALTETFFVLCFISSLTQADGITLEAGPEPWPGPAEDPEAAARLPVVLRGSAVGAAVLCATLRG